MRILKNVWYGGRRRALTMSYDDGTVHDRRLAGIFDRYGIRGSFHLNSANLDDPLHIASAELPTLFANHEVSIHTLTHPYLEQCSRETMLHEVMEDRRRLEAAAGYVVRGMSYPYGSWSPEVLDVLRTCGVACSRTTAATGGFRLPEDFLLWHPTCHHNNCMEFVDAFFARDRYLLDCFFVWGHSYEFDRAGNWDLIESFCQRASGDPDTWYATNIEIFDYVQALRALQCAADGTILHNPSAVDVWVHADEEIVRVGAGETVRV